MAFPLKLRPAISFQPVRIDGCPKPEGFLAFSDKRLVAVVSCRPSEGTDRDEWLVEAGFGACALRGNALYDSAQEVRDWVQRSCWATAHPYTV